MRELQGGASQGFTRPNDGRLEAANDAAAHAEQTRLECHERADSDTVLAHNFLRKLCLKDNEAVININSEGRSPIVRHVSRNHRVAGCLIESICIPRSKSNTLPFKTNSQTS